MVFTIKCAASMNHRIFNFEHDKRLVPLVIPSQVDAFSNTFTVIVGNNGVGKSRLLSNMVNEFVRADSAPSNDHGSFHANQGLVIAVSTSPFDKFRLPTRSKDKSVSARTNYRYIGMRSGGPYVASAISLISSATKGFLERFLRRENNDRLREVFHTLGFYPEAQLIFKPYFSSKLLGDERQSAETIALEKNRLRDFGIEVAPKSIENFHSIDELDRTKIREAVETLREFFFYRQKKAVSVNLDFSHGASFSLNKELHSDIRFLESVKILLDFDLLRLMDLRLHKHEFGQMSLRRASSGEQCMLVMMLGIAGHIHDNSLIFIDEPEISLHPRWQEVFIDLLGSTFSKYKGCQFFIATHSPQIVSKLKTENCFVTSMTRNEVFPSSYFHNMSSDFQLAELFEAPGSKNEYVTRLAFTLLSRIKSRRTTSEEDSELLRKLLFLSESMDHKDPTFELIKSVEEVVRHYASD